MPDPFALHTQDPRFNAGEPVTVNGWLYLPAARAERLSRLQSEVSPAALEWAAACEQPLTRRASPGTRAPVAGDGETQ